MISGYRDCSLRFALRPLKDANGTNSASLELQAVNGKPSDLVQDGVEEAHEEPASEIMIHQ
ncbi:unnamed protein product, partial [Nesidiocoris tenuis]